MPLSSRGLLLVAARERELLVVPPAGAAAVLAHGTSPGPRRPAAGVLIARPVPVGRRFPDEILLVSGGSPDSRLAAKLAAWIAAKHNSSASLLHVGHQDREVHHLLAEQAVELIEATRVELWYHRTRTESAWRSPRSLDRLA